MINYHGLYVRRMTITPVHEGQQCCLCAMGIGMMGVGPHRSAADWSRGCWCREDDAGSMWRNVPMTGWEDAGAWAKGEYQWGILWI